MRRFFACLITVGLACAGPLALPASAQPAEASGATLPAQTTAAPHPAEDQPKTRQQRLDALFFNLKREHGETAAGRIANAIRAEWNRSGSATVDLLMQRAGDAVKAGKYEAALDFLDEVTVLEPDFAEGWNRRATVHFLRRDYARSMADIRRTLRLEPRHFGALSGMAAIFKVSDSKQAALDAFEHVLDVYPMLRSAQQEVSDLADALAGEGI